MNPFDDLSVTVRPLRACLKLPVRDLRPGMFVIEPDCGWLNTPFLLEGLLLHDDEEIAILAKLTTHVTIDPRRSMIAAFVGEYKESIYKDAAANVSTGSAETFAASLMAEPQARFRDFLAQAYRSDLSRQRPAFSEKMTAWWRQCRAGAGRRVRRGVGAESRPLPAAARPAYVPTEIPLVIYRDPEPTPISLPQARAACLAAEACLKRIVGDISTTGTSSPEVLKEAADTLVSNMIARPSTMIWLAKMRATSNNRYQQALTVSIYLTALGRQIGFPRDQLADLATIGLLLDLGMIAITPDLLDKAEPLSEMEMDILRSHVAKGLDMVASHGELPDVVTRAIAEHHERIDGSGYPMGLSGSQISIYGMMAAIADSFVAMITPRPYAPTLTAYDAIRQLFHDADGRLHAPLVEQFVQAIGIFPVGSLVELSSGEVAIVVQHNALRRLEPKVLVLTSAEKNLLDDPRELDMLQHNTRSEPTLRIVRGLVEGAFGIDFRKYYLNRR